MKLRHKDEATFKKEGVIERQMIDAREILRTGEYEQVSDETEAPSAKDVFDGMTVKKLQAFLKEKGVAFETDANKEALLALARAVPAAE